MANNIDVKDAAVATKTLKTTDTAGVHTPHHNVDSSALPTGAATEAKQDSLITLIGEVQATPTANTLLRRLKDILTGIVLQAGTAIIGKVGIDQTTPGTTDSVSVATGQGAGATIGTASGAKVVTDANGTLQQYLRGLVSLWIAGLPAGTNFLGTVGGTTAQVEPTITVSTSPAYTAGDCVGGKVTLTAAIRAAGKGAVLQSLFLRDTSNQKAALELLIFNADPSASTLTDNNAAVIHANDVAKIIRRISIAASDYVTIDSKAFVDISPGGRVLYAASGVDLYAVLVAVGTPTYAATTAIGLRLGILQD